ncbi:putative DNA-binding protein [Agrilactobacillus yilanensis]|uniref:UPF0122 protein ACFQ5M_11995 n=1 Tax=Agrilactobacillus yilanensis TaxID=2485997 RepID=A0ABW4J8Y7_9LACO|nr:putative DNA-binding protein [Agrilactobacillus yilanensis]
MELAKNNRINELFDFYGSLLTTKQHDYIQFYYRDDYSLGEIAETFSVSRQAVYDNIHRTEAILNDYEKKLKLYAHYQEQAKATEQLQDYIAKNHPDDRVLINLVQQIETTLDD